MRLYQVSQLYKCVTRGWPGLAIALCLSLLAGACGGESGQSGAEPLDNAQAPGMGGQTEAGLSAVPSAPSGTTVPGIESLPAKNSEAVKKLLAAFLIATSAEKLQALQTLWVRAAESEITEEVLAALTDATKDADPRVARKALIALNDLAALRAKGEIEASKAATAATSGAGSTGESIDPANPAAMPVDGADAVFANAEAGDEQFAKFQQVSDELRVQALFDRDLEARRMAIHSVTLRRSAEATEVLLEALRDDDPRNRRRALEGLWYAAADGVDPDGQARLAVEAAIHDSDPEIAALAQRALDDLDRLDRFYSLPEPEQGSDSDTVADAPVDPADPFALLDVQADGGFADAEQAAPDSAVQEPAEISQSLRDQALYAADPGQRRAALRTITLSRSDSATAILIATAGDDDPRNRRRAIEGLWYAAADGFDAQGRAQLALEDALRDPDPRIAALAQRALDDLARLASKPPREVTTAPAAEADQPPFLPHQQ